MLLKSLRAIYVAHFNLCNAAPFCRFLLLLTSTPRCAHATQTASRNRITRVQQDMSDNTIESLPGSLKYLRSLEVLAVENNPIMEPPPNICARGRVQIFKWLESKAEEDHHSKHNPAYQEDVWSASGGRSSGTPNVLGDEDFNATFQPYRSASRTCTRMGAHRAVLCSDCAFCRPRRVRAISALLVFN